MAVRARSGLWTPRWASSPLPQVGGLGRPEMSPGEEALSSAQMMDAFLLRLLLPPPSGPVAAPPCGGGEVAIGPPPLAHSGGKQKPFPASPPPSLPGPHLRPHKTVLEHKTGRTRRVLGPERAGPRQGGTVGGGSAACSSPEPRPASASASLRGCLSDRQRPEGPARVGRGVAFVLLALSAGEEASGTESRA